MEMLDPETLSLLFEAAMSLLQSVGAPPAVTLAVLATLAVGAGALLFWLKINPAGVVLRLFTLVLRAIVARKGSNLSPKADKGADTSRSANNVVPLRAEQPSIRLDPPSLPNLPRTVRPDTVDGEE